ncbi:integration host factor subunit beta, partial [candidate division NPL-UPA2 bacterium]|nr:integration host factor subunit beta [candidate division NPL-UPA2 bacterium]
MTRKDLAAKIAEKKGLRQSDVKVVVDEILKEMSQSLARGEKVELRDFGIFKVKERKSRLGRNPKTGEAVPVPARKVVHFKVGKELKELV